MKQKYKIIKGKVQRLEIKEKNDVCPECGSRLWTYTNGLYSEAECMGCGYTEVMERVS